MRRLLACLVGLAAVACSAGLRRFPLREPMWRDTDLDARRVRCRADPEPKKDKAGHQICRPDEYRSYLMWDGADNMAFRPLARFFAVDPSGGAINVNSLDEVPDSSWFTNRIGRHPLTADELTAGACADDKLDPDGAADGSWVIDSGKLNGAHPGFRIKTPDGTRYLLKADSEDEPERATGATAVATRIYHAAGFYVACDQVIYARPEVLKLTAGLKGTDNSGVTVAFDQKKLDKMLAGASKRDNKIRFIASRWLPGRALGPFTYAGVKDDDPADVIPHQDRRDLRGARLLAAWVDHFDSREQNSMAVWMAEDPNDVDASPGRVIHYYIDLGDSFGSKYDDPMWRRIGHAYYFDLKYFLVDLVTLGLIQRPWDRARRPPGSLFGYYQAAEFDPESWHPGYPNPTFANMTERDGAWIARIIARFSDEDVGSVVAAGKFSNPEHSAFLARELGLRRDVILRRYFAKVSPITDLVVESGELCGVDLARARNLFPPARFSYRARIRSGARLLEAAAAEVRIAAEGRLCISLPRVAPAGGLDDGDARRYFVVDVGNGQAPGRVHAHLFDLGPERGYRLVGIERDE